MQSFSFMRWTFLAFLARPVVQEDGYSCRSAKDSQRLKVAASEGWDATIEECLRISGIDVDGIGDDTDGYQRTALHVAASKNRSKIVDQLLSAGADASKKDKQSQTALSHASFAGHAQVVYDLLTHDSKAEFAHPNGTIEEWKILNPMAGVDALVNAAAQGHVDVVELLVTVGGIFMWKCLRQVGLEAGRACFGLHEQLKRFIEKSKKPQAKAHIVTLLEAAYGLAKSSEGKYDDRNMLDQVVMKVRMAESLGLTPILAECVPFEDGFLTAAVDFLTNEGIAHARNLADSPEQMNGFLAALKTKQPLPRGLEEKLMNDLQAIENTKMPTAHDEL
mmetsp:Transcript_18889/g.31617  ORF Transcript_18889/g.31617 Transcript_18889/m.31617 type:complete len:334 (+) Transcript_18889:25-1026(+)